MFANVRPFACASVIAFATPLALAADAPPSDDAALIARIAPVAHVEMAGAGGGAKGGRSGEQLFNTVCTGCHTAGVLGSPKFGSKEEWAPRIAKGLDALMASATNGTPKGMPPRGGSDASDVELKRAVVYMANKGGASFKAP